MKKNLKVKWLFAAAGMLALAGCLLTFIWHTQPPAMEISAQQNTVVAASPTPAPLPSVVNPPVAESAAPAAAMPAEAGQQKKSQKRNAGNPTPPKEPAQDPMARIALSLVGADPAAEAYWLGAITDPNLSNQEREDLMEDLNEDGLSDPKHPGQEDMPLIANRIAIIEEIAPFADDFMLEHLGEAHKDLSNLLAGNPAN